MTPSDKLREIAEKWGWFVKTISLDNHRFELNKNPEQLLSDLTALISEGYVSKEKAGYPKEFVEWIGDDCSPCYLGREEDDYGKWVVFKRGSMEHKAEFDTLDELFNYWKENEQC